MALIELHNATIGKISTLADKTMKIELFLREIPIEQMTELMTAYMEGKEGFELKDAIQEGKTHSQRLKATLHVHWEKNTDRSIDSETYYRQEMDKIINHYKSKLP